MRTVLKSICDELPIGLNFIRDKFFMSEGDKYIKKLLIMAIESVELERGISLRKKVWKVIHNNYYVNLSFSPVNKIISITNSEGQTIKPLNISRMHENVMLKFEKDLGFICIEYESGYSQDNLPICLQNTVLEKFWDLHSKNIKASNASEKDYLFEIEANEKTFDWRRV